MGLDPIESLLAVQPVIVLDGALATELEQRGADLRDPLWSAKCVIEQPDLILGVHRDYFAAGADVATSATYQATFEALERRGMGRVAAGAVMREAVDLAVAARDEFWAVAANRLGRQRPLVAASIGPYGAMLADGSEYRGGYAATDRELREFHAPRLRVLADAGADVLACETLPCLREALVLAQLCEDHSVRAWISFSCRDGHHDCEGEDVGRCAAALQPYAAIAAIGVNCSAPEHVGALLRRMRSATVKPLVAYPNSGEHYDAVEKRWTGHGRSDLGRHAQDWYAAGARLIGGCCRSTPADIAALARLWRPVGGGPALRADRAGC